MCRTKETNEWSTYAAALQGKAWRAKRLGTTPEEEAGRLLRDRLRAEPGGELPAMAMDVPSLDPRFTRVPRL